MPPHRLLRSRPVVCQNPAEAHHMPVDLGQAERHGAARNRQPAPLFSFPFRWTFSMDVATSPSAQDRLVTPENHRDLANAIRALALHALQKANPGHPGLPMGRADVAPVLFTRFLNLDPRDPHSPVPDPFLRPPGPRPLL